MPAEPEISLPAADHIDVEMRGAVAVVSLNRPEVRNAIDDAMRTELMAIMDWANREDSVRALVLTGKGKAFCAGGDIAAMKERLAAPQGKVALNGWKRQRRTHHAVTMVHELSIPTIAAVNGPAAGLGCDLALCCDFIVASRDSFFTMSYVMRGLIPDGGGMYFLPRRVGLARAKELIFSARRVPAEEALEINMIEAVAEPDALLDDAIAMAESMTKGAAGAMALSKAILDQTFELSMEEVFALGSQAQAICYTTDEHQDSVNAFLNKSKK